MQQRQYQCQDDKCFHFCKSQKFVSGDNNIRTPEINSLLQTATTANGRINPTQTPMLKHRLFSLRFTPLVLSLLLLPILPAIAVEGDGIGSSAGAVEYNPAFRAQAEPPASLASTAQVIVKLRSGADLVRRHALSAGTSPEQAGLAMEERTLALGQRIAMPGLLRAGRALDERTHVVRASGIDSAELAQRLQRDTEVEYAVVDYRRQRLVEPNDPLYLRGPAINTVLGTGGPDSGQWYLRAPTDQVVSSINATAAWDVTTGQANIVVAILDTGVRPEHPDLQGRLLLGYDMISEAASANKGGVKGPRPDATDPGDWVTSAEAADTTSPFYRCDVKNSSWHGTLTASLVGAAGNEGLGMAGVTWGAKILPVRVLGKCGGYDSDIIAGMRWAAGIAVPGVPLNPNPARVINMSLGSSGACTSPYQEVITQLGQLSSPVLVVAAAGNSTGSAVGTPASCAGALAVGGLRHTGTKVGFSDLGPQIALSAPAGNCVNVTANSPCLYSMISANNTGTRQPQASTYSDAYRIAVGTSFSAPLVSGTVALMLSRQPNLSVAEIRSILQTSARPFPSPPVASTVPLCLAPTAAQQLECHCTAQTCGAGMLDAAAAVKAAAARVTLDLNLVTGWNLTGSGVNAPADVALVFGDAAKVESVWRWGPVTQRWAVYLPGLSTQALAAFAAGRSYDVLSTLEAGDGFWVKAKQPLTVAMPRAEAIRAEQLAGRLRKGWNLLALGATDTPQQVQAAAGQAVSMESLWAWDALRSTWFFYAPSLDVLGGSALTDYNSTQGFLDFTGSAKTLGVGVGFWVKVP